MAKTKLDRKVPMKELKSKESNYDTRPHISFNSTELPEVKDWKVGEEYKVVLQIKQTGMDLIDYGKQKGQIRGSFTVTGVKAYTEPVK